MNFSEHQDPNGQAHSCVVYLSTIKRDSGFFFLNVLAGFLSSKMNECLFICKVSNTVACFAAMEDVEHHCFHHSCHFFMLHKGVNR